MTEHMQYGTWLRRGIWHSLMHAAFTLRLCRSARPLIMPRTRTLSPQDELYSPRKAAQIIAYFAMRQGGRIIEVLKAIKLVYIADRESLRRWGSPLVHEPRVSLKLGPVNQTTLEYVNGDRLDENGWSRFVETRKKDSNEVSVSSDITLADLDELNQAELKLLDDIWAKHGQFTAFQIANWTHLPGNVPEWQDPDGRRLPIELIDILRAVNFPDPEAAIERIEDQRRIERSFGSL